MASVHRRGKVWSLRFDIYPDGKRKQIERSGFLTKKEAEKKLVELLNEYNTTGSFIENKKITTNEVFKEFIDEEAAYTRAYSTIVRYNSVYKNQLKKDLGHLHIFNISINMIEKLLADRIKGYSQEYVKGIYKLLVVVFGFAEKREYLKINPMKKVMTPPDPRHISEIVVYTKEDKKLVKERLKNTNVKVPFEILCSTGLRSSECFGLRWSDFNEKEGYLDIQRQLLYQNKCWCFAPLKTKNAYRRIYLSPSFVEYLINLKAEQLKNKHDYGYGYKRNFVTDATIKNKEKLLEIEDLINIKSNGEMLTSNSTKFMSKLAREVLNKEFKVHNLRHTYASTLAENGINPKLLQKLLGHAKIEFTLKYYTHTFDEAIDKLKNVLEQQYEAGGA